MMHHPNMHHQAMSGHPPQHIPGHQGIPGHHQMPPHQMHRENRHVPMPRVMGPSQGGGGMGGHGQPMGNMGSMGVHHGPGQRPPHPIRAMHHPQAHHQTLPPIKSMRRPYGMGYHGAVYPPPMAVVPPPPAPAPPTAGQTKSPAPSSETTVTDTQPDSTDTQTNVANSKEKTPMCLVNELARYNKIKHQYRLTSETGPAHKKVFTVTLRLGDNEEYTAEGSSIKRAQHAAARAALTQTRYPAPPPRPHHATVPAPHHRHNGTVMPTVELNALAMKLCQPAVYTSLPGAAARGRALGALLGGLVYRVRVCVGARAWLGEGGTPQAARHDAAARALRDLRVRSGPPPVAAPVTDDAVENVNGADLLSGEVKSPVSLVHELALKRNLSVVFTVKSERGPPHMRVFVTACTVGDMETEGEGNGKKVSKRRAAEKMLEEMKLRWPPALLRARPPPQAKRKPQPTKKKPRNLIKESGVSAEGGAGAGGAGAGVTGSSPDNPISRLAMLRHARRARSPQYRLLEERGAGRRREFVVQCDAPPHTARGLGPNKKTAKRRAAHNVLLAMEIGTNPTEPAVPTNEPSTSPAATTDKTNSSTDAKPKDSPSPAPPDSRQPVPGVLMMDYQQRANNGVKDSSTTSSNGSNTPGAKDQLMYLSQLLGFTVQFSDFPKRNHGEYLSLVSLSTSPPVMCHGGGASTAHSHEQCSRAALMALALMGLDGQPPPAQSQAQNQSSVPNSPTKTTVLSNGVTE